MNLNLSEFKVGKIKSSEFKLSKNEYNANFNTSKVMR